MDNLLDPNIVNEDQIIIEAEQILQGAQENIADKNQAIDKVVELLREVQDEGARELFIDEISQKFKIKKRVLQAKLKHALKVQPESATLPVEMDLPDDIDQDDALKKGFFESRGAYYFITKDGLYKASNFTVTPILHIYSKTDNKRIIEVRNEYGESKMLDLPSKNLVSTDLFQQSVFNEGNFIFFGTKIHHYRILSSISRNFPIANELRTLGWQREGFFAFANGIFSDSYQAVDDIGVCDHEGKMYFSPSFSKIYTDVREDDDEYENDRYFVYKPSPVKLSSWCRLMRQVYDDNAITAIAFFISSMFRSLIYDTYKIFPHLFLFGEKQSGKSQLAWSLSNAFFDQLPAFNLNSGTQVGFFRRLSRVKNALCWFDEYTNDIDERRFQSLKSAYDGMGHEKGKMSKDSRTEVTKVNSASVISGQYLPTRDDNSLLTRSVLLPFEKKTYSREQIQHFDKLKELETKGISSIITEILLHRQTIERLFTPTFADIFDQLKYHLQQKRISYDERLVRNHACIMAIPKIVIEKKIADPGFSFQELFQQAVDNITNQTAKITNSEAVYTFWSMIQFMYETTPPPIAEGQDFKIQTFTKSLRLRNKKEQWETMDFGSRPAKLIFFRFSKIHPLYMEAHRKQYGKNGVDLTSMLHYIKHHKAYIGYSDSTRFDTAVTSAYVFDYDLLNISLESQESLPVDDATNPDDPPF